MDYRNKIISDIAERECKRICRKVILLLQKMTEGLHSGDDSPLRNIWDEVCVQVQFQESVYWDVYLDTIRTIISPAVEALDVSSKQAIWLQTSGGMDWEAETEDENDHQQVPSCSVADITEYILNDFVLARAVNWTNQRIERYEGSLMLD
jgi:hypothetical protein